MGGRFWRVGLVRGVLFWWLVTWVGFGVGWWWVWLVLVVGVALGRFAQMNLVCEELVWRVATRVCLGIG